MREYEGMFKEEAGEQLYLAEQALLTYESNPSKAYLDEAFRALHTFKGAANMFSFSQLGDFAHKIESVLDEMRKGVIKDAQHRLNRLLIHLDHLRNLMNDPALEDARLRAMHTMHTDELINLSSKSGEPEITDQVEVVTTEASEVWTYYLNVKPIIELTQDSGHPVIGILEGLHELGSCKVVPVLAGRVGKQIGYWDVYLACPETPEELHAQFMFIDDEINVEVNRIGGADLLHYKGFDLLLEQIGKLEIKEKIRALQHFLESRQAEQTVNTTPKGFMNTSIRVSSTRIDTLMDLVSELITDQASLTLHASTNHSAHLERIVESMERHVRQLREVVFEMTLVPMESMVGKFKRLVRDVSKNVGKDVQFMVEGANTELDKTLIDKLADPIMHMLRNCVDHGIEKPETRLNQNKSARGTVKLKMYYSGSNVHIEIMDDGRGLDFEAIRSKAVGKGLIQDSEHLSEKELGKLIFLPGFSTARQVSDVSGRGVGMDVVKKNITALRGDIDLESKPGSGTTLTIRVPLTLSVFSGLLVRIKETYFVVPLQVIDKCFEVSRNELSDTFNRLIVLEGKQIPFIEIENRSLNEEEPNDLCNIIAVCSKGKTVALVVDEIIGEHQTVVKPVGEHYRKQQYIAGATLLGDGTVALVLDVDKLIESKIKTVAT